MIPAEGPMNSLLQAGELRLEGAAETAADAPLFTFFQKKDCECSDRSRARRLAATEHGKSTADGGCDW